MLENISLIASVICGITAITSSLRAVGASREFSRNEAASRIKAGCRIGTFISSSSVSQRSNIKLHIFVTSVWYTLSVIFILPFLAQYWMGELDSRFFLFALPFILLAAIILFIWTRVCKTL